MGTIADKLASIPGYVAAVADYEPLARERLDERAWAYVSGGASDEVTLRENAAAFRRRKLRAHALRDLTGGNTRLDLFGRMFTFPILLAPVAYQKLLHPRGELETALAASAQQAGMVVSTQASVTLEDIAREAQAPLWFQLYVQPDREFTRTLVRRAEQAGYEALVVTVDAPVSGMRNREQRAGFALPPEVEAANLRGMAPVRSGSSGNGDGLLLGGPLLSAAPTWRDIGWLRSLTRLPLLIKGIMTAEDASRAVAEGADGIVVSNHGGRVLDMQPATVDVLPGIVESVGTQVPVLLDGGIRRGTDVLTALALGARAVMIGRPFAFGLAAAGAIGVSHVVQILRAELEVAMACVGCRDLGAIDASALWTGPPEA
ncbi:MAG: alpha-hydroxy-acid oxidizing protein [Alphaproteobacteria bacterium]|nr:alpha-hydroxy-acid oxidizing protein [Alphaproteobacteria bacterium]